MWQWDGGTDLQRTTVETALRSMTFPWERILAAGPVTIRFVPEPTLGTATPTLVVVSAQDAAPHVAEVVKHEIWHLYDARFTLPRDLLAELFCRHTPAHTWRQGQHIDRISEAFSEAGKQIFSGASRGGYGDHQIDAAPFTRIVLDAARPFGDLDGLPDSVIDDIALLKAEAVTFGTGQFTFDPHSVVSRSQMASFLARILRRL